MIKGLHHFGIRVDDLAEQVKFYESLGFTVGYKFKLDAINADAVMMMKNGTGIELFQFADSNDDLAQKIKKHSAFITDDIENDVQKFLDAGYELALPIDKGRIMKKYAYVKDAQGNYIELCVPSDDIN